MNGKHGDSVLRPVPGSLEFGLINATRLPVYMSTVSGTEFDVGDWFTAVPFYGGVYLFGLGNEIELGVTSWKFFYRKIREN